MRKSIFKHGDRRQCGHQEFFRKMQDTQHPQYICRRCGTTFSHEPKSGCPTWLEYCKIFAEDTGQANDDETTGHYQEFWVNPDNGRQAIAMFDGFISRRLAKQMAPEIF